MKKTILALTLTSFLILTSQPALAGSAIWNLNPTSDDWNTAANWTPETVPNGSTDTATFGVSNTTTVFPSVTTEVGSIVFDAGASPFTINVANGFFDISDLGIVNNSGTIQNFVTAGTTGISFHNAASAGSQIVIINTGATDMVKGGFVTFRDNSSAGEATVISNGATVPIQTGLGGQTVFIDQSSAGNGTFISNPAGFAGAQPGETIVSIGTTAANGTFVANGSALHGADGGLVELVKASAATATFTANGGTVTGAPGGSINLTSSSTGDNAIFTANGSTVTRGLGGTLTFSQTSDAGNATLIANSGSGDGKGGIVAFTDSSTGGTARVQIFGNGELDISNHSPRVDVTIGSLEGSGYASFGTTNVAIGSNNLSTTFSGHLENFGSTITKVGNGTLTLRGANDIPGITIVDGGTLVIANRIGSATGTGSISVNSGRVGGNGTIGGVLTIGDGTSSGAALFQRLNPEHTIVLTVLNVLTFESGATYNDSISSSQRTADSVTADGVTINNARILLADRDTDILPLRSVFTLINNTSATPISGTFGNLADASTIVLGNNTFQVSYEGGDGNDLTLTVVP
ncbi:MAG TPA: autotransporter-associated beta strand repeat-containing protein [Chthoniobacterales bacterium]|jgi:autotransporter-associated beta strand protein